MLVLEPSAEDLPPRCCISIPASPAVQLPKLPASQAHQLTGMPRMVLGQPGLFQAVCQMGDISSVWQVSTPGCSAWKTLWAWSLK